jgi:hypothetical protein
MNQVKEVTVEQPRALAEFLKKVLLNLEPYSIENVQNSSFELINTRSGSIISFTEGSRSNRQDLFTVLSPSKSDLEFRIEQVLSNGGSIKSGIKELRPEHFSAWVISPTGWTFGIASSPALNIVLPFELP